MNISADMKEQQLVLFKEGKVKQSTLLKALKEEIKQMILMGFKPGEIMRNLEHSYGVEIDRTNLYSWLKYNKESLQGGGTKNEEKSIEESSQENTKNGSDDDTKNESTEEVEVSKNNTSSDSEKSAVVNLPERKRASKLDDDIDASKFNI